MIAAWETNLQYVRFANAFNWYRLHACVKFRGRSNDDLLIDFEIALVLKSNILSGEFTPIYLYVRLEYVFTVCFYTWHAGADLQEPKADRKWRFREFRDPISLIFYSEPRVRQLFVLNYAISIYNDVRNYVFFSNDVKSDLGIARAERTVYITSHVWSHEISHFLER